MRSGEENKPLRTKAKPRSIG